MSAPSSPRRSDGDSFNDPLLRPSVPTAKQAEGAINRETETGPQPLKVTPQQEEDLSVQLPDTGLSAQLDQILKEHDVTPITLPPNLIDKFSADFRKTRDELLGLGISAIIALIQHHNETNFDNNYTSYNQQIRTKLFEIKEACVKFEENPREKDKFTAKMQEIVAWMEKSHSRLVNLGEWLRKLPGDYARLAQFEETKKNVNNFFIVAENTLALYGSETQQSAVHILNSAFTKLNLIESENQPQKLQKLGEGTDLLKNFSEITTFRQYAQIEEAISIARDFLAQQDETSMAQAKQLDKALEAVSFFAGTYYLKDLIQEARESESFKQLCERLPSISITKHEGLTLLEACNKPSVLNNFNYILQSISGEPPSWQKEQERPETSLEEMELVALGDSIKAKQQHDEHEDIKLVDKCRWMLRECPEDLQATIKKVLNKLLEAMEQPDRLP